jgi:hypothetical protein
VRGGTDGQAAEEQAGRGQRNMRAGGRDGQARGGIGGHVRGGTAGQAADEMSRTWEATDEQNVGGDRGRHGQAERWSLGSHTVTYILWEEYGGQTSEAPDICWAQ